MQLQARLSPSRIGSELIVLLGLEHLIDGERDLRSKLADAQQRLANRIDDHDRREREWAAILAEIDTPRQRSRCHHRREEALAAAPRAQAHRRARRAGAARRATRRAVAQPGASRRRRPRPRGSPDRTPRRGHARRAGRHRGGRQRCGRSAHTVANEDVVRRRLQLEHLAERISALTTKALAAPGGVSLEEADRRAADAAASLDRAVRSLGAAEDVQRAPRDARGHHRARRLRSPSARSARPRPGRCDLAHRRHRGRRRRTIALGTAARPVARRVRRPCRASRIKPSQLRRPAQSSSSSNPI